MKALKTLTCIAVSAVALAVSSSASAAVMVSIGYSLNNAAITDLVTDATPAMGGTVSYNTPQNIGAFNLQSVSSTFGPLPNLLNSNSIDAKSNPAGTCANPCTLDIFVTMRNILPGFLNAGLLTSSFSASDSNKSVLSTFYNTNNAKYGQVLNRANATFTGAGGASSDTIVPSPSGQFSLTEKFHLVRFGNTSTTSNFNGTIDISTAAVPEPATWGLMIAGFGGIGMVLRSRRRAVFAKA
jgi:hypothetical protein